jgi:hypothetical protein
MKRILVAMVLTLSATIVFGQPVASGLRREGPFSPPLSGAHR